MISILAGPIEAQVRESVDKGWYYDVYHGSVTLERTVGYFDSEEEAVAQAEANYWLELGRADPGHIMFDKKPDDPHLTPAAVQPTLGSSDGGVPEMKNQNADVSGFTGAVTKGRAPRRPTASPTADAHPGRITEILNPAKAAPPAHTRKVPAKTAPPATGPALDVNSKVAATLKRAGFKRTGATPTTATYGRGSEVVVVVKGGGWTHVARGGAKASEGQGGTALAVLLKV